MASHNQTNHEIADTIYPEWMEGLQDFFTYSEETQNEQSQTLRGQILGSTTGHWGAQYHGDDSTSIEIEEQASTDLRKRVEYLELACRGTMSTLQSMKNSMTMMAESIDDLQTYCRQSTEAMKILHLKFQNANAHPQHRQRPSAKRRR